MVQGPLKGREKHQENLCEELLRERAAVLARAGFAVEDALAKLKRLDRRFGEMMDRWQSLETDVHPLERQSVFEEINEMIDRFNAARQKAEIQYYYLIVTREALGLRRHETVQKFYQIPPKKKKMQAL
ncbi:MAG TPA: hypothetical protein P5208_01900 [Smithellaceae bacterium]|mgnify:FL=1|nr:hypothetical protein [Smithellaceae bacterium]HRV44027.1 hypothetical protein [Smithellaceae bacterium]